LFLKHEIFLNRYSKETQVTWKSMELIVSSATSPAKRCQLTKITLTR
jgi:hypothetical protein